MESKKRNRIWILLLGIAFIAMSIYGSYLIYKNYFDSFKLMLNTKKVDFSQYSAYDPTITGSNSIKVVTPESIVTQPENGSTENTETSAVSPDRIVVQPGIHYVVDYRTPVSILSMGDIVHAIINQLIFLALGILCIVRYKRYKNDGLTIKDDMIVCTAGKQIYSFFAEDVEYCEASRSSLTLKRKKEPGEIVIRDLSNVQELCKYIGEQMDAASETEEAEETEETAEEEA